MPAALVVNADDLGVSRGATLGIVRAHREGIVTSASLAPTTPAYSHAVETCARACPELGIGLHFTLTAGRPVSAPHDVPLLVDERGLFRWRFFSLLRAAGLQARADLLEQVEIELEAQVGRLLRDGIRPDHVDGERHVHLIPGIFERVAAAARRHGIPFVRLGRDIGTAHVAASEAAGLIARAGFAKAWLLSALSRRDRRHLGSGLRSADHFASYVYSGRLDLVLRRVLERPPASGVTEIMVHPGMPEAGDGASVGNRELERYLASGDRAREMEACLEARGSTGGWTLTTFGRLALDAAAP